MKVIYCNIRSAALWGIEPYLVEIEADISSGMPYFNMVGLLASEVREARERVRSALHNSGEAFPTGRVTVNLSPADRRKEGTAFDLPIAVALLCADKRLPPDAFEDTLIIGELGLDGEIKAVHGVLPIVAMAEKKGIRKCILPYENRQEASMGGRMEIEGFHSLRGLIAAYTQGTGEEETVFVTARAGENSKTGDEERGTISIAEKETANSRMVRVNAIKNDKSRLEDLEEDFFDIRGQETVKRAIVVAVAGHHHMLMTGAPGVGKSMLASRIAGIMPSLTREEKLEISGIYSICGKLQAGGLVEKRPFLAPHHTITMAALIGGGHLPSPGVITMAHRGVLFLDELPEFHQNVLDSLRQPLEEKVVKIHRSNGSYIFPADFLLTAAMNPCKCGYYPDRNRCHCSETDVRRYQSRISGPLLDRMDMNVEVPRVSRGASSVLSTKEMKKLVTGALAMQKNRQKDRHNSALSVKELEVCCRLEQKEKTFVGQVYEAFELSMRGYHKLLKIARTIADVEQSERITVDHLSEALAFRMPYRK